MHLLSKDLYTARALDTHKWEVLLSDEMHPVFKAHFEGNPLLPAFLQVDIVGELLNKSITKIERCKFKQPIRPNDTIIYDIVKQVDNMYRVNILKEDTVVSEIKILCAGA